jgi:putative zinc finger/helix-turn-helix YgiT family protein
MKCVTCGAGTLGTPSLQTIPYGNLPGTLLTGIEVRHCSCCGDEAIHIPRMEELYGTLVRAVAHKPGRLDGAEVRFLRARVGWTANDLARHFGTDPATVGRWESGAQPMEPHLEMLLRVVATRLEPISDYGEVERLLALPNRAGPRSTQRRLRLQDDAWTFEGA